MEYLKPVTISSSMNTAPFLWAASLTCWRKFLPVARSTSGSLPGTSIITPAIFPGFSEKTFSSVSILLYSNGCMKSLRTAGIPLFLGVVTAYQSWHP